MVSPKKQKTIRTQQYESILNEKYGLSIKDCSIMGFKFNTLAESYAFHYLLMENNIDCLIYDGATEKVRIFLKENNEKIKDLAIKYNGEYYKPMSYNDYE